MTEKKTEKKINELFREIFLNLEEKIPFLGLIASFLIVIYAYVNIQRILFIIPGILTSFSCLLWIIIREKQIPLSNIHKSSKIQRLFFVIYILFLIISLLLIRFRIEQYERPLFFFITVSVMAGAIACQIIFSMENQKWLIFPQIIILGITICWSQLLIFPTVLGVDPWYHQLFTTQIIETHFIPGNSGYSYQPIFHLIITISSFFCNLNYKLATMLSVSLIQIICNVFLIYLITIILTKNEKMGLMAALMIILADYHILMTYWSIPNSLTITYVLIAIFFILKSVENKSWRFSFLSILLFILIILGHSITSVLMATSLLIIWVISKGFVISDFREKPIISIKICLIFIFSLSVWWSYASGHLRSFVSIARWGFSRDIFYSQTAAQIWEEFAKKIPTNELIFNQLGMFLFFTLAIIGIFYMISMHKETTIIYSLIAITPLFLGFFSILLGLSIIEGRWWFFSEVFLSIPLGIAIIFLLSFINSNKIRMRVIFLFVFVFSFLLIMSPVANSDNHIFSEHSSWKPAISESELFALSSISFKFTENIGTDNYYAGVSDYVIQNNLKIVPIDEYLYQGDFDNKIIKVFLIRDNIKNNAFALYQTTYKLSYNPNYRLERLNYSKTYDTKTISIYNKNL